MHTFNFSALNTQTPISQGFIFCFQTVKSFKYLAQRTSLCPMPKAKCQDDCTIKVVCKSMVIPTNAAMIKYSYNILIQIQCDAFMTRSILFKIITIKHTTGLLPDTLSCGLYMRQECRERFPSHRGLAIPTCIRARVRRTCPDACLDR